MKRLIGAVIGRLRGRRPALRDLLSLLLLILLPLPLGIPLVRWLVKSEMLVLTTVGCTALQEKPAHGLWRRLLSRAG